MGNMLITAKYFKGCQLMRSHGTGSKGWLLGSKLSGHKMEWNILVGNEFPVTKDIQFAIRCPFVREIETGPLSAHTVSIPFLLSVRIEKVLPLDGCSSKPTCTTRNRFQFLLQGTPLQGRTTHGCVHDLNMFFSNSNQSKERKTYRIKELSSIKRSWPIRTLMKELILWTRCTPKKQK